MHKMTLEEKFKKAETISPAWERVTLFSWNDLVGMRDRIKELEEQLANEEEEEEEDGTR